MVIFIDESGTLPDVADRYIVIAALSIMNIRGLDKILPKFRKILPLKGVRKQERKSPEFKFHYVGDITRKKVLKEITVKDIKVYLLIIDKMGRKIKDSPENYGKLVKNLIISLLKNESPKEIYLDKHFGRKCDTDKLQSILNSISHQVKFWQVNSMVDSRIDLADFIAGAILRKYRSNDDSYYNIIKAKIVWEKVKQWNGL